MQTDDRQIGFAGPQGSSIRSLECTTYRQPAIAPAVAAEPL
jgi:hypothetical protein